MSTYLLKQKWYVLYHFLLLASFVVEILITCKLQYAFFPFENCIGSFV